MHLKRREGAPYAITSLHHWRSIGINAAKTILAIPMLQHAKPPPIKGNSFANKKQPHVDLGFKSVYFLSSQLQISAFFLNIYAKRLFAQ